MVTEPKQLRPFLPISPGEILREELEARGWTQSEFAEIVGKPIQTISEIINAKKSVTPETAVLFSEAFGTSAEFWLNLEASYRLDLLSREKKTDDNFVERKAKLFSIAPIGEMIRLRWIRCNKKHGRYTIAHIQEIEAELLKFFRISSLDDIPAINASFRKSSTDDAIKTLLQIWLTQATRVALKVKARKFNIGELGAHLEELVRLSAKKPDLASMQTALAQLGVRLVHVPHFTRTKLDGAAFWLDSQSPVIAVTLRINRVDNFWFTLMHEIAHLVLSHAIPNQMPMLDEDIAEPAKSDKEVEADKFAQNALIPPDSFKHFLKTRSGYFTAQSVRKFADELAIHPAIVVGRLQHEKLVPFNYMRNILEPFH